MKSQSRWFGQGHISTRPPRRQLHWAWASAGEVSSSAGPVVVPGWLSQCDGWGDDPTGASSYRTQHGHEAAALRSLFPSFSNKWAADCTMAFWLCGRDKLWSSFCHAVALTQRLSETHKYTIMVQWLYLVDDNNPSMWALKLVKGGRWVKDCDFTILKQLPGG